MVEVRCEIPLPVKPPPGYDQVVYQLTLDKLVTIEDEYWITDYKFYKQFSSADLAYDKQLSAYIWAGNAMFDKPVVGGILHEFKKQVPERPRILRTNGKISTAANQNTTHRLYREALINMYGAVDKAPSANVRCLNELLGQESEERDGYIKRSRTRRTLHQQQAEGTKILMEVGDMCNPDLPIYTNETRDCSWDCGLREICLMLDRGDDWEWLLNELTIKDTEEYDQWRTHLQQVA
jgi:hypothetical protein